MNKYLTFISLITFFFIQNVPSAFACFQGCVVDECSGEPLVNHPIRVYDPNANGGVGGSYNFTTDEEGCFNFSADPGSWLYVGDNVYYFNGGPCVNIGVVSDFGIGGKVKLGSTITHVGNPFDVGVYNHQIHGCQNNPLSLTYISPNINPNEYCVKIDIYQRDNANMVLVEQIDWTPLYGENARPNIDFSQVLEGYSQNTYRVLVSWKCCEDEVDPEPKTGYSITSGNFVWNPNVSVGDVEFSWIGSMYTESVNNDGDPNNNSHPNDGTVWDLGQFTVGINGNVVPGSGAVTEVKLRVYKILSPGGLCNGGESLIDEVTVAPTNSGTVFSNFLFNSELNPQGYFFNATDYTVGETCFRVELEVIGSPACPSITKEGYFRIALGNIFGITDNTSSDGILGQNALADAIVKESYDSYPDTELTTSKFNSTLEVYPNPATDIISIEGIGEVDLDIINISGQVYKVKSRDDKVDISALADGIYILQIRDKTGAVVSKRLVKQR